MTITITSLSRNQWAKVGRVFLWVALSLGLSAVVAYATHRWDWLLASPGVNVIIVALTQVFQQEVTDSEDQLPVEVQGPVDQVVAQVDPQLSPSDPPIPATQGSQPSA